MEFISPTDGELTFPAMFQILVDFIVENTDRRYNLIVGTDSMDGSPTTYVTAIVAHRVGKGGRYFYRRIKTKKPWSMKQRIFYEAALSLETAGVLAAEFSKNGYSRLPVEIHLDMGENGATRDIIKEVVGMVTGSGYRAVVKPEAYAASKVADRHSK